MGIEFTAGSWFDGRIFFYFFFFFVANPFARKRKKKPNNPVQRVHSAGEQYYLCIVFWSTQFIRTGWYIFIRVYRSDVVLFFFFFLDFVFFIINYCAPPYRGAVDYSQITNRMEIKRIKTWTEPRKGTGDQINRRRPDANKRADENLT